MENGPVRGCVIVKQDFPNTPVGRAGHALDGQDEFLENLLYTPIP